MGVAYLNQENIANAIECFHNALQILPSDPLYNCNLGLAYKKSNAISAALCHFHIAIQANPNASTAYIELSKLKVADFKVDNPTSLAPLQNTYFRAFQRHDLAHQDMISAAISLVFTPETLRQTERITNEDDIEECWIIHLR